MFGDAHFNLALAFFLPLLTGLIDGFCVWRLYAKPTEYHFFSLSSRQLVRHLITGYALAVVLLSLDPPAISSFSVPVENLWFWILLTTCLIYTLGINGMWLKVRLWMQPMVLIVLIYQIGSGTGQWLVLLSMVLGSVSAYWIRLNFDRIENGLTFKDGFSWIGLVGHLFLVFAFIVIIYVFRPYMG